MKKLTLLITIFLSVVSMHAATSKEAFKASVIQTLNEKDWVGYKALTCLAGMNAYDLEMMESMQPIIFDQRKIIDAEFAELPANQKNTFIYDKRKFSQTIPAEGALLLKYATGGDTTLLYANDGENYVLVSNKSQTLDWSGPDDVPLSIMIIGHDIEGLKINATWNVSGVSISEELSYMSTNFSGQYIEQVSVQSEDPDAVYQLKILQAGKEIYASKQHTGIGEIKYQRNAQ
jgi:hypothetical protein